MRIRPYVFCIKERNVTIIIYLVSVRHAISGMG